MGNDPLLPPTPEAGPNDTISANRALPIVAASQVPQIPAGFRPTEDSLKRKLLRRVGENERAELKKALVVIIKRGASLSADLGKNAPPAESLQNVLERIEAVEDTKTATQNFQDYLEEVEDIALSDALQMVEKVRKLYHANLDDDPNLKTHYAAVDKVFEARGAAISEGIARKKGESDTSDK